MKLRGPFHTVKPLLGVPARLECLRLTRDATGRIALEAGKEPR